MCVWVDVVRSCRVSVEELELSHHALGLGFLLVGVFVGFAELFMIFPAQTVLDQLGVGQPQQVAVLAGHPSAAHLDSCFAAQ